MSRLNGVSIRLLGMFAIEASIGRAIPMALRSKKARAVVAWLAMKPDYQARRAELATLLWGDNPDMLARQSLRQCLISLRQDLSVAAEIITVDREMIGLRAELVSVDARTFVSLARSANPDDLAQAAELWRGPFLPDLVLDIETYESWHRHEADRLLAAAAGVFDALCRTAEANGDADGAIAAAERLLALDPTREDWQRTALKLVARHSGREAALSRAKSLAELLRNELDVAPEPETRALIAAIERGEFAPAQATPQTQPALRDAVRPVSVPDPTPLLIAPREVALPSVAAAPAAPATQTLPTSLPMTLPFWRRRPRLGAWLTAGVAALGVIAAAALAVRPTLSRLTATPPSHSVVVLPFAVDGSQQADDTVFARSLTHNVIGYLSRFGTLRVISEPTSEAYRDRAADANLMSDLGVQYAIVGRVQGTDSDLKIDFDVVNTATRSNVWSDSLRRERGEATVVADEAARGIARALGFEIDRLAALAVSAKPSSQLTLPELVSRGYLALQRGTTRDNLDEAMQSFAEALQRNPHYLPALLAVARLQIVASSNFIDLDPPPDLNATEQVLNETLAKYPKSMSALYSLALLQKHSRQYQASMRTFQRCLELNPGFLAAQAQIGDLLARTGEPERGLVQILQTIRAATVNDPSIGYWYLFAAEAELQLGHDTAALNWALRADAVMPTSPLVQAWLASIYANAGDKPNAARYVAALTKMAPVRTRQFMERSAAPRDGADDVGPLRIFEGLRLALAMG
jgi:DNA-binding SARP family transcriptional activator/TolB-like protein